MEYFKLIFSTKKKTTGGEVTRNQYLEYGVRQYPCFKCEQFKLDCIGAKKCRFSAKLSSTPINSQEVIDKKFEQLKEAKTRVGANPTTTSTQLMTETEIVQSDKSYVDILSSFDKVIQDELSHDGYIVWEWQFS